ncbi:hypothetical protein PtB15_18B416 [Puccinia triticina]|nr:hypothetical protein PtB15_18B416 [Puccinia triticina]
MDSSWLVLAGSLTSDIAVLQLATPEGRLPPPRYPSRTQSIPSPASSSPLQPEASSASSYVVKIVLIADGQWLADADSKKTLHADNLDAMNVPRAASVAISCKVQNLLRVTRLDDNETPVLVERPFFDLLRHTNSAHGPAALPLVWQRTGAYGT